MSSLPGSISALSSLRILGVTEDLRSEEAAGAVKLPASLTALSGMLHPLSISTLAAQAPLLQLTFLMRLEVDGLLGQAQAAPVLHAFQHLRDAGALQLLGDGSTGYSCECYFSDAVVDRIVDDEHCDMEFDEGS